MKYSAIYCRISTDEQSTDSQLQQCQDFAQNHNITTKVYSDTASGSTHSRKALDQLMQDARKGKINTIITYKIDRLGRSVVHLAQLIGELHHLNVALVCISQGIDTRSSNPVATMQMQMLMVFAEFERSIIKERVLAGLKSAKAKGIPLGRPKGSKLNLNPTTIHNHLNSGLSLRKIAALLHTSEASIRRAIK